MLLLINIPQFQVIHPWNFTRGGKIDFGAAVLELPYVSAL